MGHRVRLRGDVPAMADSSRDERPGPAREDLDAMWRAK